jgi:hypothetical protein
MPRYPWGMDINIIGNVLLDLFEIEAFVGLALLAVVLVVLARALLADHRVGPHPHYRAHR